MNVDDAVAIITTDHDFLAELDGLVATYENNEEDDEPTDLEVAVMLKIGYLLHARLEMLIEREPSVRELSKLSEFLQAMYEGKLRAAHN